MIQCESCERYFHADEIQICPECGHEFCEADYEKHQKCCSNSEDQY